MHTRINMYICVYMHVCTYVRVCVVCMFQHGCHGGLSSPSPSSPFPLLLLSSSKVHLVRQIKDDSLLVVKQIPIQEMPKEERQAALNEVDVLKMLKHPNIVAYEGSFLHDQSLMIVMEYAPGTWCACGSDCLPRLN